MVRRWVDHLPPQRKNPPPEKLTGGSVHIRDHALVYERFAGRGRQLHPRVVLAEWNKSKSFILLNGDGLDDRWATQWQTRIRIQVQNRRLTNVEIGSDGNEDSYQYKIAVIPFLALDAAGIVRSSIRPLDIRPDVEEIIYRKVMDVIPPFSEWTIDPSHTINNGTRRLSIVVDGRTFHHHQRYTSAIYRHRVTGETTNNYPYQDFRNWSTEYTHEDRIQGVIWTQVDRNGIRADIFPMTENHRAALRDRLDRQNMNARMGLGMFARSEIPDADDCWYIEERIHHLGACVFSAETEDGGRHKFVSAFDEDEPNQMYFLAQLPDRSGVTCYAEAIESLAPEMVKEARRQGRQVYRQGDVFAIETNLKDKEVYSMAKTRVRREAALYGFNPNNGEFEPPSTRTRKPPVADEHDTTDDVECPTCGHHTMAAPWGPKCRQALMIYNTGHTATEVVVTNTGSTYIRGTMHHDPYLEEIGRAPEHVTVRLGPPPQDGGEPEPEPTKWFLACRNTVPRRRRQRVETPETETEEVTVRNEGMS